MTDCRTISRNLSLSILLHNMSIVFVIHSLHRSPFGGLKCALLNADMDGCNLIGTFTFAYFSTMRLLVFSFSVNALKDYCSVDWWV